jgi:glycosyltransferase involved in cell wall biosynthesis
VRILFLTQWFQPEPFFKGLPLAKALCGRGHEVEVLTGFPNYPGGKLYPGYRVRPWRRESIEGIRVNRVALYPSHDRNPVRRLANYLSFAASTLIVGPWVTRTPDIIYVYNLITLGPAARLLRQLTGAKIVLDVQDLWPESVAGSGMMTFRSLHGLLTQWSNGEYRRADRLIVLSPGFKQNLTARGIPSHKIDIVYNWCDETSLTLTADRQQSDTGGQRFNVVFAGTMGKLQSLDVVLEAAATLAKIAPDVLFTFVGGGTEVQRLRDTARDMDNVRFLPFRPPEELASLYQKANALLVHLRDDPLFRITIPSKVQSYLYVGKPILCGVRGDAAELVTRAGAGICFEPDDARSLTEAVIAMRSLSPESRRGLGEAGHWYYQRHLSFERGVDRFISIFNSARQGIAAAPAT